MKHIAAQNGHSKVVQTLIENGADTDKAKAVDGAKPVFIAAQHGHKEVVNTLIDAGADIDKAKLNTGPTPLHIAAQNGHVKVVHTLLQNGQTQTRAGQLMGQRPCFSQLRMAIQKLSICLLMLDLTSTKPRLTEPHHCPSRLKMATWMLFAGCWRIVLTQTRPGHSTDKSFAHRSCERAPGSRPFADVCLRLGATP